jgi:hypothetical protein
MLYPAVFGSMSLIRLGIPANTLPKAPNKSQDLLYFTFIPTATALTAAPDVQFVPRQIPY